MTDDSPETKVTRLPIQFKSRPSEDRPMLEVLHYDGKCNHRSVIIGSSIIQVKYLLRDGETEVECGNCGMRLDPMWVLKILANEENHWFNNRARYLEEMKRLSERSRTECQHCGKMTKISSTQARSG